MASTRGIQLIRTDDSEPGIVRFYDRRQADVKKAFISVVDVRALDQDALIRAARHGITQNILDASNKLEGDERVDYIAKMCERVQNNGWASAPVDEAKLRENAINALVKLGIPADKATEMVDARG